MAALDSFRRQDFVVHTVRRNTVASPPPYSFNALDSHRPASRLSFSSPYPYRTRRSTVSDQGHNVNSSQPLAAHGSSDTMWSASASASSSPTLGSLLPASSPTLGSLLPAASTPSSSSSSPRSTFDSYPFASTLHPSSPHASSFSLYPSPDYPDALAQPRMPPPLFPPRPAPSPAPSSSDDTDPDSELARLRNRVRELECDLFVARLDPDNKYRPTPPALGLSLDASASSSSTALPLLDPPDWPARTAARLKRFCALNRAGNALCAWHDSRRERRAFPPRMAPPDTLNCGCTYKEALFEESLARNDVGAFYPGDSTRMDPALRNPLLRLLEKTYGYRDGDFERTPGGGWREGEDARSWEQRAVGQRPTSKRER